VIVTAPPVYALLLPDEAVDAWQFEALLEQASSTASPEVRHGPLSQALRPWRGRA